MESLWWVIPLSDTFDKYKFQIKVQLGLLENEVVRKIADKTKKTPAQVVLRWSLQRNVTIIPKSQSEHRLRENLAVGGFSLQDEDMDSLNELKKENKKFLPDPRDMN